MAETPGSLQNRNRPSIKKDLSVQRPLQQDALQAAGWSGSVVKVVLMGIILLSFMISSFQFINAGAEAGVSENVEAVKAASSAGWSWSMDLPEAAAPALALTRALSGSQINFTLQNGVPVQGKPVGKRTIPHLVLHRNGELTPADERTLIIEISRFPIMAEGMTVILQVMSQHTDPDQKVDASVIPLWETTARVEAGESTLQLTHTFTSEVESSLGRIPTPTDYLQVRIRLVDAAHTPDDPLLDHTEAYALLLENQWVASLDDLSETDTGAAPDEIVIYYCDMFPYQREAGRSSTRLPRADVDRFVREELAPKMVSAIETQTNLWGFPWASNWTSYRGGADAERISVALTMPGEWFHGRAPGSAHSGISIVTSHEDYENYATLAEGILSAYYHELFHNVQRNLNQAAGGNGDIDGGSEWAYFTEGMAILASAVGQPEVEFSSERAYLRQANSFLAGNKFVKNDLNRPYADLDPYRGAIYWRFLYEQCGGLSGGSEDPSRGMVVIRNTLQSLYNQVSLAPEENRSLVQLLPVVMDDVLGNSAGCPFSTYKESLAYFARHIYQLRLQGKDCDACGFYDPDKQYAQPSAELINPAAGEDSHWGEVPASYGIDFIEIEMEDLQKNQPLRIEFATSAGEGTQFNVQIVRRASLGNTQLEILATDYITAGQQPQLEWSVQPGDLEPGEGVAVIVTRVDADEEYEPSGEYSVSMR